MRKAHATLLLMALAFPSFLAGPAGLLVILVGFLLGCYSLGDLCLAAEPGSLVVSKLRAPLYAVIFCFLAVLVAGPFGLILGSAGLLVGLGLVLDAIRELARELCGVDESQRFRSVQYLVALMPLAVAACVAAGSEILFGTLVVSTLIAIPGWFLRAVVSCDAALAGPVPERLERPKL